MSENKKKNSAKTRALRAARRRRKKIRRIVFRCALYFVTVLALLLVALYCAGLVAFRGPSQSVGDLLTVSMLETSALKFIPRLYYNNTEYEQILLRNTVDELDEEIDTSLIVIATPTPQPSPEPESGSPDTLMPMTFENSGDSEPEKEEEDIELHEINGSTYHGYMMIVKDPSRVSVGVCRSTFNSESGLRLNKIAEKYGAVAAINGGGFEDAGGKGNGGMPTGLVISNGVTKHKADTSKIYSIVIGFNQDNVLVIGKMTTAQAEKKGLRDALAFGPALVYNGEPVTIKGSSSGLNPRSAIGQRADGAVLMLVIDGRQSNSLGATYADLISIMLEYGAVNAANLDGGSSSLLYYNGAYVNDGVVLTGSRNIPTAFIVR